MVEAGTVEAHGGLTLDLVARIDGYRRHGCLSGGGKTPATRPIT